MPSLRQGPGHAHCSAHTQLVRDLRLIPQERVLSIMSDCQNSNQSERTRILLVDDDSEFIELIRVYLGTMCFKVIVAGDGVEALKAVLKEDFHLIVCDLSMPNLPGDLFYVAIKRTKPRLCRRFLFVTGAHQSDRLSRLSDFPPSRILYKPLNPLDLVASIRRTLAEAAQEEATVPESKAFAPNGQAASDGVLQLEVNDS